jgi:hypothetical protein
MGDRLERLYDLRDQVSGWLSQSAADRAQLVLRLTSILEQIDELERAEPEAKGTVLDELAKRRTGKAQAPRPARTQKREQRRG